MKYTVEVNGKSVVVILDGHKGVAKCCEGDTFNLQTGIELALERAKVAKAETNKSKPVAKPTVAEAKTILEEYVGDHIAVIGKGKTLSDRQKRELWDWAMALAPEYAPKTKRCHCCSDCDDYERGYGEGYEDGLAACDCEDRYDDGYSEGYTDGYEKGYADGCDECECDCCCDEVDEVSTMARRMIARIEEILGE